MYDISIPEQVNTGELKLIGLFEWLKNNEDLRYCNFLVEVRDRLGNGTLIYQWKSGGSGAFPNSVLSYDYDQAILTLYAPSVDVRKVFSPALIAKVSGGFYYEIGYFRQGDSVNMVSVGTGRFPMRNGVIVGNGGGFGSHIAVPAESP